MSNTVMFLSMFITLTYNGIAAERTLRVEVPYEESMKITTKDQCKQYAIDYVTDWNKKHNLNYDYNHALCTWKERVE